MPGGNRKRDFDSMNEDEPTKHSPPLKRSKQKCTWCERERERNDLCNRCRQKVESRAKKLLEQKIIGDHHVVKDTLEFIRENVAVSQMRGVDVLQCLEDLFPAKFLLSIFDKQYKGKKGNDVFSCPDRVLRIIVPEMIPGSTPSSSASSLNRDALKSIVQRRVDSVLSEWQNRDLSSFDVTMSRPGASDSTSMNDPSLVNNGETQSFLRKVALTAWSTQNVASFLESCGVRPQVIMQSLRVSNSLNITGRKFLELSDEDLRVKWQLADHSAAEILRHRCCYLWCCEQIVQSNLKTMPNGIVRFPIPLGFHGSSYDRLEKELRLYGLRLIAITSSYDPMSLVNKIPQSLRFGIDIIVAQGDSHVLTEMIGKFTDTHAQPSATLVRHSVQSMSCGGQQRSAMNAMHNRNFVARDAGSLMASSCGYGGSEYGSESHLGDGGSAMPPEVAMNMDLPPPPMASNFMSGRNDPFVNSALSLSPLSGSSLSPLSEFGSTSSHSGGVPAGRAGGDMNFGTNGVLPMVPPDRKNNFFGSAVGGIDGTNASGYETVSGRQPTYIPQEYSSNPMYPDMSSNPAFRRNGNFGGVLNPSHFDIPDAQGYPMGNNWDARFDNPSLPNNAPMLVDSGTSNESMASSSSSVGCASDGMMNEWQSLLC